MKKVLFGFLLGIIAITAFLYFGGPGYVKLAGSKTEEAGARLEKYEEGLKHTAQEAKEAITDTAETVKEKAENAKGAVRKTIGKTKEAVDKGADKVKEYAP